MRRSHIERHVQYTYEVPACGPYTCIKLTLKLNDDHVIIAPPEISWTKLAGSSADYWKTFFLFVIKDFIYKDRFFFLLCLLDFTLDIKKEASWSIGSRGKVFLRCAG